MFSLLDTAHFVFVEADLFFGGKETLFLPEIQVRSPMESYYLLHAIMGEFNVQLGNLEPALRQLREALELTSVHSEKTFLEKKLRFCEAELAAKSDRLDTVHAN